MRKLWKRLGLVTGLALGLWAGGMELARTNAASPATKPAGRTSDQIRSELIDAHRALREVAPKLEDILGKERRAEVAPKAIPLMRKMLALFEEASAIDEQAREQRSAFRVQFVPLLVVLGDAETAEQLKKAAAGTDQKEAAPAKMSLLMVDWYNAMGKAEEQTKVLDEVQKLAKSAPEEDALLNGLMMMRDTGAANEKLVERIEKIVAADLKGPGAEAVREDLAAREKLASMENKPLVIKGMGLDGKEFSTEQWKGKVILVDFWATWCGPCRAELPEVKKTYAKYHDKGLEVLGVSCDRSEDDLKAFLAQDKEMPWPQLFDKTKPGWHQLAKDYGIQGIPTMFLIDKKGILRSVRARENYGEMIPKLLEEDAK